MFVGKRMNPLGITSMFNFFLLNLPNFLGNNIKFKKNGILV